MTPPLQPRPKLPLELWLGHVAHHVGALDDLVALIDVLQPRLRQSADIWRSDSYRQLVGRDVLSSPVSPPSSYGVALRRRPAAQTASYGVTTTWSRELAGAALAGPYLATAYRMAHSACPVHPLLAANVGRAAAMRDWLDTMSFLGSYLVTVATQAPTPEAGLRYARKLRAYVDRGYHAASLAAVLLPNGAQDAAVCALRQAHDAAAAAATSLEVELALDDRAVAKCRPDVARP